MNVTQPLTRDQGRDRRIDAVDGDVEVGDADAPAHVHPLADGSVHEGDPADQEQKHAEIERETGRPGPGSVATGT